MDVAGAATQTPAPKVRRAEGNCPERAIVIDDFPPAAAPIAAAMPRLRERLMASEALKRMVDGINIRRKQVYVAEAQDEKVTVQEYAFTAGCVNIANTTQGEKYQAPNGSWKTRDADLPDRDPRCQ